MQEKRFRIGKYAGFSNRGRVVRWILIKLAAHLFPCDTHDLMNQPRGQPFGQARNSGNF